MKKIPEMCRESFALARITNGFDLCLPRLFQLLVLSHNTLTLIDMDGHGSLPVLVCGECLAFLGWDDGVSVDQLGHHTTNRLNAEGQRSNVQQNHAFEILIIYGCIIREVIAQEGHSRVVLLAWNLHACLQAVPVVHRAFCRRIFGVFDRYEPVRGRKPLLFNNNNNQ